MSPERKQLTNRRTCVNITELSERNAGLAQPVERLIRNQCERSIDINQEVKPMPWYVHEMVLDFLIA